ncbi:MAG: helix-turn-helix domain-containing protein [Bacteroidales bacterium]|nr:helix-turn-helix domain-containing protein [Bacteroidales bacterium]
MTNKEKFMKLVSDEKTDTIARNRERIKNRAMLRESQRIALKVLLKLDELGWTQKDLASKMSVSPQQINKIVSGKENLTIGTQIQLQDILDIPILASYYENKSKEMVEQIKIFTQELIYAFNEQNFVPNYKSGKVIKMRNLQVSEVYPCQEAINE